ncbi:hypothetical protein QR680_000596 [Steinernema hermaphroditum]|uniref:Chromo domain-containing protein n=1 Tax=Steinernema hermaphroditum TaxID=289476 RepID=A0AA39LED5_9BILA|nr:hypothetical protein QR680_000596 [Steinernema hermaphroditum]
MPRPMKRIRMNSAGEAIVPSNAKKAKTVPKKPAKEEDVYQVERIIDSRRRGKSQQFLVKWVGYTEPTWEPRANILDYNLIKEYDLFKRWDTSTKKLGKQTKLDKNKKIEKIVSVRNENGVKKLLVKFEESSEYEVHEAEKVFKKHPNLREETEEDE